MVDRLYHFPERQLASGSRVVMVDRLVLVPARERQVAKYRFQLVRQCGRGYGFGQDAQARPLLTSNGVECGAQLAYERVPVALVLIMQHRRRTIGIVERQQ